MKNISPQQDSTQHADTTPYPRCLPHPPLSLRKSRAWCQFLVQARMRCQASTLKSLQPLYRAVLAINQVSCNSENSPRRYFSKGCSSNNAWAIACEREVPVVSWRAKVVIYGREEFRVLEETIDEVWERTWRRNNKHLSTTMKANNPWKHGKSYLHYVTYHLITFVVVGVVVVVSNDRITQPSTIWNRRIFPI